MKHLKKKVEPNNVSSKLETIQQVSEEDDESVKAPEVDQSQNITNHKFNTSV